MASPSADGLSSTDTDEGPSRQAGRFLGRGLFWWWGCARVGAMTDRITLEVIGSGLAAIAEEMGTALIRASYSANVKERRDCSTAVFDAAGRVVAQAEHIPMHLGSLLGVVREGLARYPVARMAPGEDRKSTRPHPSHL